jgi:hypothetical protein
MKHKRREGDEVKEMKETKGCDEVIGKPPVKERESQRETDFFSIKKVIGKLQCYPMYWVAL